MAKALSSKTIVWIDLAADVAVAAVETPPRSSQAALPSPPRAFSPWSTSEAAGCCFTDTSAYNRAPTPRHSLGHGRELFFWSFWSFVVALQFFTLGAGFSIYEGVQRMMNPSAIRSPLVICLVLGVNALLDAVSWVVALKGFRAAKGDLGYWQAIKSSKDPPGFIVLVENTAGLAGIAVAAAGTFFATKFGVRIADGAASVLIGVISPSSTGSW